MKILVLGGTRFVGRHFVEQALGAGHELTLFNRGKSGPGLFPEVEHLVGDRDGGLDVLAGRRFDRIVDTCGYVPRIVEASARMLLEAAPHYTFISTISVYGVDVTPPRDETAELAVLADPSVEVVDGESYGGLKVLCEKAVQRIYASDGVEGTPSRGALIIRPGLIVGPHDHTDRFSYWPMRLARGGNVLAPGLSTEPVQFVDVRDLVAFTLKKCEEADGGIYNLTGPEKALSMGDFMQQCQEVTGVSSQLTWVDEAFLEKHEVAAYSDLPLWVPSTMPGFSRVSSQRAISAGLCYRPLRETIADTLKWRQNKEDTPLAAGLSAEREAELLKAFAEL